MRRWAIVGLGVAAVALAAACGLTAVGSAGSPEDAADGSTEGGAQTIEGGEGDARIGGGDASGPCTANVVIDPSNCGACGHDCLGGACSDGGCQPVILLSGLTAPFGVAVDADRIYWSTGSGTIAAASLDGGSPVVVVADAGTPAYIAVVGSDLYWTDRLNPNGSIVARTLPGGAVRRIVAGERYPTGIAVVGTTVYWTVQQDDGLSKSLPDGGSASVSGNLNYPEDIVSDSTSMFIASPGSGIMKVALTGGNAAILSPFPDTDWAAGIDLDGNTLYFTFHVSGKVARMPKTGGPVETIAVGQSSPYGIAVDAKAVYWANNSANTIMRLAK